MDNSKNGECSEFPRSAQRLKDLSTLQLRLGSLERMATGLGPMTRSRALFEVIITLLLRSRERRSEANKSVTLMPLERLLRAAKAGMLGLIRISRRLEIRGK